MNPSITSGVRSGQAGVNIPSGLATLHGDLAVPISAQGIVLFAHGSGSSRHSPRNRQVAHILRSGSLGTLLMDLLTAEEEEEDRHTGRYRFDIGRLVGRLVDATKRVRAQSGTQSLRVGLFGASTGAAAALIAAANGPDLVSAIVSRGGRPDLAGAALSNVQAPTLLIVGGHDSTVLDLNERAMAQLTCEKRLEIIPRATHLFEEPGALEAVARLARAWFKRYLAAS
ncbi:MAG TPA: dienelactone hydrolase family protein [Gammaproteobacteria bacterium]|nr:dienelactone hydrolase family protein [Gammaproteobacteria bacterium]